LEACRSSDTAEDVNEAVKYRRTGVSVSDIGQTGSWWVKRQTERTAGVSVSDIGQTGCWWVKRQTERRKKNEERNM
jgi:beta-lactamase superfamily II metal-dependent hydrolase